MKGTTADLWEANSWGMRREDRKDVSPVIFMSGKKGKHKGAEGRFWGKFQGQRHRPLVTR